jgi:Cof subfamily protein (haloacid dehalogenase superfamily)
VTRLVATDLDGTIVRRDGTISERTRAALAAVEDAGIRLVLVTGRPPRWLHEIADMTGHRGLAICANGALVYDLHAELAVEEHLLSVDAATEAMVRLSTAFPHAGFAVERASGFARTGSYRPRWDPGEDDRVVPLSALLERPVAKLLVRDETSDGDAMLAVARPLLAGVAEVTHSNVNDCLLEISGPGVTKASTLQRLAASHGVDAVDVVAFGDMPNDVPMLRWAGRSYAVASGHPEARAAADEVVPGVEEDGVAVVLERLTLIG